MRRKFALLVVSLCAACCLALTAAWGHWFFYLNLASNPSAEDGSASPDGMTVVPIPGWTATGAATVVAYGTAGDFPTEDDRPGDFLESQFFAGGPDADVSTLFQAIDVPQELWSTIDGPLAMTYDVAVFLGGFGAEDDNASMLFCLKNSIGENLESCLLGPMTAADRNGVTGLLYCARLGIVPPGTRRIELTLTFTRVDGSYNNAFADYVWLRFLLIDGTQAASWGEIKNLF